jgi:hypothetical protein
MSTTHPTISANNAERRQGDNMYIRIDNIKGEKLLNITAQDNDRNNLLLQTGPWPFSVSIHHMTREQIEELRDVCDAELASLSQPDQV